MNTCVTTASALEKLEHQIDPHPVFARVGLLHCKSCGRVWRFLPSAGGVENLFERPLEPTGWTSTAEMPDAPRLVDEVQSLSEPEMFLWNKEPCPGPPCRGYPGALENAVYRLMALGELDPVDREIALKGLLPQQPSC